MVTTEEFYKQVEYDCALCGAAQQIEAHKAGKGSRLAELRATELNTYLSVFLSVQYELAEKNLDTYPQEELAEIMLSIDEIRDRFVSLLADPQYTGQTGKIYAELAEKERAGNT